MLVVTIPEGKGDKPTCHDDWNLVFHDGILIEIRLYTISCPWWEQDFPSPCFQLNRVNWSLLTAVVFFLRSYGKMMFEICGGEITHRNWWVTNHYQASGIVYIYIYIIWIIFKKKRNKNHYQDGEHNSDFDHISNWKPCKLIEMCSLRWSNPTY